MRLRLKIVLFLLLSFTFSLQAQIQSDYNLKLIEGQFQNVNYPGFDIHLPMLYFVAENDSGRFVYHLSLADQIKQATSTGCRAGRFFLTAENKFMLIDVTGKLTECGTSKLAKHWQILSNRVSQMEEAALNNYGNLLALYGKVNKNDRNHLMTYDLKYDNLNVINCHSSSGKELSWSPQSAYLSYTIPESYESKRGIGICRWDGSCVSQIRSDTVELSGAKWGLSTTKFACIAKSGSSSYIFVLKTDGSLVEKVLQTSMSITSIAWSPNGLYMAAILQKEDENTNELWLIDLESTP